jgi:hypothetical protein
VSYDRAGPFCARKYAADRLIIVLSDDLAAKNFPLPLRKNDKALVQGEWLNIENLDPSKRGIAGAIEIHAKGAR